MRGFPYAFHNVALLPLFCIPKYHFHFHTAHASRYVIFCHLFQLSYIYTHRYAHTYAHIHTHTLRFFFIIVIVVVVLVVCLLLCTTSLHFCSYVLFCFVDMYILCVCTLNVIVCVCIRYYHHLLQHFVLKNNSYANQFQRYCV